MSEIQRAEIVQLLEDWQSDKIDESQVHRAAEYVIDKLYTLPLYENDDPKSIAVEVIFFLDDLYQQLVIKEDIPLILKFLNTPVGMELEAWKLWQDYWDNLDYVARQKSLENQPYYSQFKIT